MTIPKTPFSTPLSHSARETETRIRNIFRKKKRPDVIALLIAVVLIPLCGSVITFQPRPQMPEIVMAVQYYDSSHRSYIEIPTLTIPGGAEPSEGISAINQALAELSAEYQPFIQLLSGQSAAESSDLYENLCLFYPCAANRYLNLIFFRDTFHTDLNTGHVLTLVYDTETGRQVTLEDALALAGISEEELFTRLSTQIDPELDGLAAQQGWGAGALRVQNPVLEGFRIRTDGTVVFYLTAREDDVDDTAADYISGADHLYLYQDGVFSRYDQYSSSAPAVLVPAEETLQLDQPLWCQWYFEGTDSYQAILLGEAQFLYTADGAGAVPMDITSVPALFSPDSDYAAIGQFAVVDLDSDGEEEVLLQVIDVGGDMGGYLILHRENGTIYGCTSSYRTFWNLKTDGTFDYSNLTENGTGTISFTETGYVINPFISAEDVPGEESSYFVDHQPVTMEKYDDAMAQQTAKPDAVWYEFTGANIETVFQ